jgi:hypothetical protein
MDGHNEGAGLCPVVDMASFGWIPGLKACIGLVNSCLQHGHGAIIFLFDMILFSRDDDLFPGTVFKL